MPYYIILGYATYYIILKEASGFGSQTRSVRAQMGPSLMKTCYAQSPSNIVDFRGFDSIIILVLRGEILMSIGDFPESLSQAMLVGVMLVEKLGVDSGPIL